MQLKGRIELIREVQQITETFSKREFVLITDENSDYPQFITIQLIQDKTRLLDQYKVGDVVTCEINIEGRKWVNPEGEAKYFNTIKAWKVFQAEVSHQGQQVESQSAQSAGAPVGGDWLASDDSDDLPF